MTEVKNESKEFDQNPRWRYVHLTEPVRRVEDDLSNIDCQSFDKEISRRYLGAVILVQ